MSTLGVAPSGATPNTQKTQVSTTVRHDQPRRMRRGSVASHLLLPVILVLAGVILSLWPVGHTLWANRQGSLASAHFAEALASTSPEARATSLRRARDYNAHLASEALSDPWSDEAPATSPAHDDYVRQLADLGPMGRIRIPAIDVDLTIEHDATQASLAKGAGHMYGTSLPVGGEGAHAVIAAHTDAPRTFFDRLPELIVGDVFYIDTVGGTLAYEVDAIHTVSPSDLSKIVPETSRDLVTLVTCVDGPSGGFDRLLVRGTRVVLPNDAPPHQQGPDQTPPVEPTAPTYDRSVQRWMVPRLVIAGLGTVVIVGMMVNRVVAGRRTSHAAPRRLETP